MRETVIDARRAAGQRFSETQCPASLRGGICYFVLPEFHLHMQQTAALRVKRNAVVDEWIDAVRFVIAYDQIARGSQRCEWPQGRGRTEPLGAETGTAPTAVKTSRQANAGR